MNENLRLLKPFFRGLPIIILSIIIALFGAKKYLSYTTPMYESTAKLKLADIQEGVSNANLFKNLDVFASANKIATEIEVLKSTELIEKTINELPFQTEIYRKGKVRTVELYNNSPILIESTFNSDYYYDKKIEVVVLSNKKFTLNIPNENSINGEFGKPIILNNGQLIISLNEKYLASKKNAALIDAYEIEFLSKQQVMAKIYKNLDIVPVDKNVPVIRINLKSNIPEKAAMFVNKLSEMYIEDYIENKFRVAKITVDFLNNEISTAGENLSNSENNIQNFRDQKNIINFRQETETDLRKISQLKIQQTSIKMNLEAIKDLNKYVANGKKDYLNLATNFESFSDLLSTEIIKNMKKLQAEKKDLLLNYTPNNEKVKIIDEKLNDLIVYQIESIKNTEKNLQIKYNDLSNDINKAEQVFNDLPEKERIMAILERKFNTYEKNYNFLNEKKIEADIAKSAKIAFHQIITPGKISKSPVSPIKIIIIIVAAFLGFLISTILIYLVHFTKEKVNDVATIEKISTIPIALSTPYLKDKNAIEINFLKEALQLEIKNILTPKSIITITSFHNSKEHLFHSKNLIQALQKQKRKILIVDGTSELKDLYNNTNYINLNDNKFLELKKEDFSKLIEKEKNDFDLCIIHNQTLNDGKLSLLLMALANQNLFILDSRKTTEKTIPKIEIIKEEYKLSNMWFILNRNGYNPSIITEIKKTWNKYSKKQTS
jgi:uncharacterized protein involved in exopolysaccharide biosynthesis